jgi:signal transduction histidine kinase
MGAAGRLARLNPFRRRFRRLSTKLAVLYGGLFGVILIVVALAVVTAITRNAERMVRDELQSSGTVFERILALRAQQAEESAALLARDFGFREAVATADAATVRSALQNLRARLDIDLAFIVGADGKVVTDDGRSMGADGAPILKALEGEDSASGVFTLDGSPYQTVSAPVLAPALAGWVVLATKLDDKEMGALERLAAIPLQAVVLDKRPQGWTPASGRVGGIERGQMDRFVASALTSRANAPTELKTASGAAIALVKPLDSLSDDAPAVLLLRYPLAQAMAPFQPLIRTLVAAAAGGVLLVLLGSFMLAANLARPITALDAAARRLAEGETETSVPVEGDDELARLAASFNRMAGEIADRETTMRRDAETLAVALDRAESANRATNEFLANMSHELRTPLNGVLGMSHVLATISKDPAQQELIKSVIQSASGLEALVSDILDAARLGAGQTEICMADFPLGGTMRSILNAWSAQAAQKKLVLALDLAPGTDVAVTGDPERLRQILDNLIGNAIKFTPKGEVRLSVRLVGQGRRFRFEVADTGVGFDPSMKERLFQKFQQADTSATRRFGGTGLGLAISRGLAELMGGTLDGDPRPEGGSLFFLELPLAVVAQAPRAARA